MRIFDDQKGTDHNQRNIYRNYDNNLCDDPVPCPQPTRVKGDGGGATGSNHLSNASKT